MKSAAPHKSLYNRLFKRIFDLAGIAMLVPVALPAGLLTALALSLSLRSTHVLFRQQRPGLGGKIFTILKFRTMTDAKSASGELLPDDLRLTRTGRAVRSLSLDELPQLLNVARGEMSFVGPRPLLPKYLPLYSARQAERHLVRPGITGLAQVCGRNAIAWHQKFEFDHLYVDTISLKTDIKIVILTLCKVIAREGVSAEGTATMPEFDGTN